MIEFKNVSKIYKDHTAVKNLGFTVEKGEFIVLVGPSGSGKTTTLKLINRLLEPTDGIILLDGKEIKEYPLRDLRLKMGYVLQQIALFPNLTVAENIGIVPTMKQWTEGEKKEETDTWLRKAGLEPAVYRERYPAQLSGGEQQRVGIIRAVIGKPEVLLMDEPFSALDPVSRRQLQDLVKALQRELKITTVFVTHDMTEALYLGDCLCIMDRGEIIQKGTPEEIRRQPKNDFVRRFFLAGGESFA